MRTLIALLKASIVAALVFALAWIRLPLSAARLGSLLRIFIGYGLLIVILSLVIGFPLVRMLEKYRMGRWWSYTAIATTTGTLLAAAFTSHPVAGIQNPFALTFSPWTRNSPGFTDSIPISSIDYVGSIAFGAIVGGALGLAFWYFHLRGTRPN